MTTKKRTNYINNRDLLHEVVESKKTGQMTNKLAHMLLLLCQRYAGKSNFSGYTYNEDMQGFAMLMLVRTWQAFDPAKSQNPFAFFTQCIKHSFIQYLNQEKRQRDIRDEILVQEGMSPSYNYQIESEKDVVEEDNNDEKVDNDNKDRVFAFDEENQTYNKDDELITY